ncbi:MAG TPA: hypothetical protein VGR24_07400 [bacterium]|jgi:hypothetical protein|nr:hypothetical protein [bacterium]
MIITSTLDGFSPARIRSVLKGLPAATGYRIEVKPLRYRTSPHLAGLCDYETKVITVQVPEPFAPFHQRIPYRAQRLKVQGAGGDAFKFRWFSRNVLFRTKTEVIRFLYCHEYYHYYLYEVLERKGSAETACDRFALEHFRRR